MAPPTAPTRVPPLLQRAVADHERGRTAKAVTGYQRFLARHPRNPQVWELAAMALTDLRRSDEAVDAIERALQLEPDAARRALHLRLLHAAGRDADALAVARAHVAAEPDDVDLLVAASQVAVRADALDEVVGWSRRALRVAPAEGRAMVLQAIALRRQERHVESVRLLEQAVACDPTMSVAHYELGVVRFELGEATMPLAAMRRAIAIDDANPAYWSGLGMVLNRLGRFDESVEAYDRALALTPGDPLLLGNQSWPLIGAGRFEQGWRQHELGFANGTRCPNRTFTVPQWDGARTDDRLMVWREQGIGDVIRCATMIPDAARLAPNMVFEVESRLVSLMARSLPQVEVRVPRTDPVGDYDLHCPVQSLAAHVRPDVASYRRTPAYLVPDPERVERMRTAVARDGRLEVGISWRSMALATRRLSYYTVLGEWAPVLGVEGVRFWNLQYGDAELLESEREMVRRDLGVEIEVVDGLDYTDDVEGVTALLANLDVVVTVGTAVSCLAGGLGMPTLLLDVEHDPFRFGQDDYPWFPSTEMVLRGVEESWEGAMHRAASRLRAMVADRPAWSPPTAR